MYQEYSNPDLKHTARKLRNTMTEAEKKLWYQFLRTFKPRVHRQRAIGNYIVDFYIPKASLIIEVDGDSHFIGTAPSEDSKRTEYFNSLGLEVLRFTNHDVFSSFDAVCRNISEEVASKYNTPLDPL